MVNKYIRRQDVIDLWNKYRATIAVDAIEYDKQLRQLPIADVVPTEPQDAGVGHRELGAVRREGQ